MPLDGDAQWQIDILAADRTAAAFLAIDKRLAGLQVNQARMAGATESAGAAVTSFIGTLKNLAIGYATVETARKLLEIGLKSGELGNQASQLGVTTDQLQAYRVMASQTGVAVDQLDAALIHYAGAAGQAKAGNDEMIAKFDRLGVKLLDANKQLRPTADTLPELARGLLAVSSSSERTALEIEFFGKSGARMQTMLEGWAAGNDKLVDSARKQNSLISPETIKAWDDLGNHLNGAKLRFEAMVAEFGKPVAIGGLIFLTSQLAVLETTLGGIATAWKTVQGVFETSSEDLLKRRETLEATVGVIKDSADPLDQAKLVGIRQELQRINDVLASRAKIVTMPTVTVTAGALQPTGKTAGEDAKKFEQRLKELEAEHKALDAALAAFSVKGTENVDEVDKRLNAQVALSKKIVEVLKDVPPGSPLAKLLTQEAIAVSQGNLKLDERKRLLAEGERITSQFGDGTAVATRQLDRLGQMLAARAIDQGTYERAVKATTQAQEDQARTARGAAGGFDALVAGVEQGAADLARANTAFEIGKRGVNELATAITSFATGAETDFGKVAISFGRMLLQMELQAAASNLFNSLTGKGATNQGLFGSLLSSIFGPSGGSNAGGFATVGSGAGATNGVPNFMGMAGGGDAPIGEPFWVGEDGPELMQLDRPGHVYNRHQMAGGSGGGNVTVNVFNTAQANVRTRSSKGPGGAPRLDVLVEPLAAAMAGQLSRGQGPMAKVIEGRYGLSPVGR
jgi:exonuclease VII small subunit